MTQHAQARLQQRGIPAGIIERLLDFGSEMHDHSGGLIVYFDRTARAALRTACGREHFKQMESHLGTYAVVGRAGQVITVGHRTRRINRD